MQETIYFYRDLYSSDFIKTDREKKIIPVWKKNQYNDLNTEQASSLIDVAKAAGYNVIWLSNQIKYGLYDTLHHRPREQLSRAATHKP